MSFNSDEEALITSNRTRVELRRGYTPVAAQIAIVNNGANGQLSNILTVVAPPLDRLEACYPAV